MPLDQASSPLFTAPHPEFFAPSFDFKAPDYVAIFKRRLQALARIRADPKQVPALITYYREHIPQFVADWGMTFDPRNVEIGLPAIIPFVLFQKQVDWIDWFIGHWKDRSPGISEKSREVGLSWLAVSTAASLCLFNEGVVIGFGSRKEDYVDRRDEPRSLFWKARLFLQNLPTEFRGGWDPDRDAPHMRINFPVSGSHIGGEAGDNIGRGDRTSIYIVDEAAHLENPKAVDAALSMTTNCRIDISSVNGFANTFAERRHSGKIDVFTFRWQDDPRKDDAWYAKKCAELDPVIVAQEIDISYSASVEGLLIPHDWALAAVDAHKKLNIPASGARFGALDVADEGSDKNSFIGAYGIVVEYAEEWSGEGSDIFKTVERAFDICDRIEYREFRYDADGLGAGCRGDARVINDQRLKEGRSRLKVMPFRGSEGVFEPEREDIKERKNKDYFVNRKAQSWWSLRERFRRTYRWVIEGTACDPDDIISLSSSIPVLNSLINELSRPTYMLNGAGKLLIDKKPDGTKSPNLADGVMIRFARVEKAMMITDEVLRSLGGR